MGQHPRSGSAVIYCIVLASIIVIVGYGFLRSTMRDIAAGGGSHRVLLAEAAARAGVAEATEAILADYAATSLEVGSGTTGSVVVANPPTFLDGPYRAPFVSQFYPNRLANVDHNAAGEDNDVAGENPVVHPLLRWMDHDGAASYNSRFVWHSGHGMQIYDGRGRYIEPGYHNVSRPSPASATPRPVVPTQVMDLAAAVPERSEGLFLDQNFRRITTGNPADDRLGARYRLRYAVGVIDLGGQLLSNPRADLDVDWRNPANSYRVLPSWLQGAQEAWYNMVSLFPAAWAGSDRGITMTTALRWQHVFSGRGNASNYDRQPGTSLPVTFPMMFRIRNPGITPPRSNADYGDSSQYWGLYSRTGADPTGNGRTTGLFLNRYTAATAAGGEPLKGGSIYNQFIFAHVGPQASWFDQLNSIQGALGTGSDSFDGAYYYGEQAPTMEVANFLPTPFGRGVVKSAAPAGARKWYEGRLDCPWYVNLLTAPPRVIHAMVAGYLPPNVKSTICTQENYFKYTGLDAYGNKTWSATPMNASWQTIPAQTISVDGRDLFTELSGAGFSEFPAPADSSGLKPNFLVPDTRTARQRYPGRLWNGSMAVPGETEDDMGRNIDVDRREPVGYCSHLSRALVGGFGGSIDGYRGSGGWKGSPPAGFNNDLDRWSQRLDPTVYRFADSYWWDLVRAFTTAAAVARAAWVQYPSTSITPATAFSPASLRDPSLYDSIEEVDRLFLRQLGEDFDNPGNGIPLAPILCTYNWDGSAQRFGISASPVSNTIRTLVTNDLLAENGRTSQERGRIMERVLNDLRMSFFGSSPQYCDAFRPFDFDGDGKVMCSCYASSGDPVEQGDGTDRWALVAGGTSGRGPEPVTWFSLTGCFYIGKSHYFRLICRGEVFDNVVQRPVADATLESVLVVDPEGDDITQSHYLFQRWHHNRYTGQLSRISHEP
jgi:hypothetical protein